MAIQTDKGNSVQVGEGMIGTEVGMVADNDQNITGLRIEGDQGLPFFSSQRVFFLSLSQGSPLGSEELVIV